VLNLSFASKRKKPILPENNNPLLLLLLPRAHHKLLHVSSSIGVIHDWLVSRIITPTVRFGGLIAREEAVVSGCRSEARGFYFLAPSVMT